MTLTIDTLATVADTETEPALTDGQAAVLGALLINPGATAPDLAAAAGVSVSTGNKALTLLADMGLAERTLHEPVQGKRIAATWAVAGYAPDEALAAEPDAGPDAEDEREAADVGETLVQARDASPDSAAAPTAAASGPEPSAARLGAGALRTLVAERLAAQPETEFSPSMLSKLLDRSAGAISNCLDKLTGSGDAEMTSEKPRRFRHRTPDCTA